MNHDNLMHSQDAFSQYTLKGVDGAVAKLYPYGAHVTNWITSDGVERLFLSSCSELRSGTAIRGGVPIIFPQFADLGPLPKHGLARTACWQCLTSRHDPSDSILFRWVNDQDSQRVWPYSFSAQYLVTLEPESLSLSLSVENTGEQAFSFTAALHTYLRVNDIASVSIKGLEGLRYRDSANGGSEHVEPNSVLRVSGELDRIYFGSKNPIDVEQENQRTLRCLAQGFSDTVVWNPGALKSSSLADMEVDGFKRMICIEAAVIDRPVVLRPRSQWTGTQLLKLV